MARRGEELTIVLPTPKQNGGAVPSPFMVPAFTVPPGAAGDYRTFNRLLTEIAQATRYDDILHLRLRVQQANTLTEREAKALLQVLAAKWVALAEVNHQPEEVLKAHLMTSGSTPEQIERMPSMFSQRQLAAVTESEVYMTDGRRVPLASLNPHEMTVALAFTQRRI